MVSAAQPVLGIGTPQLTAWLDEQAQTLKHAADGARQVLIALSKLPVHLAVDPWAAADARDRTVTYFTKRLAQVQYAAFQAAGLPDRQWQHRECQQAGGRGATQGQRHALGASSRRSAGGTADRRPCQSLARSVAAN